MWGLICQLSFWDPFFKYGTTTYISSDLVINQHWKYYFANLKTGSETELQLADFVMNILSKPFWISWLENLCSEGFCIVLHISYEQHSRHCCAYSERYVSFVELETHPRMSWQCAYSILFLHTYQKPRIYLVITGFNLVTPEFRGATQQNTSQYKRLAWAKINASSAIRCIMFLFYLNTWCYGHSCRTFIFWLLS